MPTSVVPTGILHFLGASVSSFSESANWQQGESTCSIQLVEDLSAGDLFSSGIMGAPYSFIHGSGRFDGLLQRIVSNRSKDGFTFTCDLISPNTILEGTKVVLSNYNGPTSGVVNLFNVFGYYENLNGFGGSQSNTAGMPWNTVQASVSGNPLSSGSFTIVSGGFFGIKPGIETLQATPSAFGSGLYFRNYKYTVNFSGLPQPPSSYRIGGQGPSINIREIVDTLCNDAGVDYIVKLNTQNSGTINTISFKTIDRTKQLPLDRIQNFINSNSGHVISSNIGYESVNEDTTLFLVGGSQQTLMLQTDGSKILPFFGTLSPTQNQIPAIGTYTGSEYTVTVDAREISDLLGGTTYSLTTTELRLALAGEDMWAGYLWLKNPSLAATLNISTTFSTWDNGFFTPVFNQDFIQQNPVAARNYGNVNTNSIWTANFNRVYQFINRMARDYYGKLFLVQTPIFVQQSIEPETNITKYSYVPCDGGWADNATPLSLQVYNQLFFQNENSTFSHFVRYANTFSGDITSLGNSKYAIQGFDVYIPARVRDEFAVMYPNGYNVSPSYVVMEIDTPYFELSSDGVGGINYLNSIFGVNLTYATQIRNANIEVGVHPRAFLPDNAAIAMLSNQNVYGPWISGQIQGKTEFRQNTSLTPWTYGGYNILNRIANAELSLFTPTLQVIETGSVTVEGLPQLSLGDAIAVSGGVVTDLQTQEGPGGVTTTYNLRIYSPRKGQFLRENFRRLQVIAQNAQSLGRTLKQILYNKGF